MNTTHSINLLAPKSVVKVLGTITIILIFANLFFNAIKYLTKDSYFYGLVHLFQLSAENNIPSFFSGCLFLTSAIFLMLVWKVKRYYSKPRMIWGMLSLLFVFLAYDELFQVHEALIKPIRNALHTTGLLYEGWVIVYVPIVILLAVLFYPEWKRLPNKLRLWFCGAAVTFIGGAVGVEMIDGAYFESIHRKGDVIYGLMYTTEESLEMAGLLIFIYSLMLFLEMELQGASIAVSQKDD